MVVFDAIDLFRFPERHCLKKVGNKGSGRKGDILPLCVGTKAGARGWFCRQHRDGVHRK